MNKLEINYTIRIRSGHSMPPASSSPTDSNSSNGSDLSSSSPPLGSSGSYIGKYSGNGSGGGITLYPASSSSILGLSHHHHQVGRYDCSCCSSYLDKLYQDLLKRFKINLIQRNVIVDQLLARCCILVQLGTTWEGIGEPESGVI